MKEVKKKCKGCIQYKSINDFGNLSRSKDGKKAKCKTCCSLYNKSHPVKTNTKNRLNIKRNEERREHRILKRKIMFDDGVKKECTMCGIIKPYLDFHAAHCKICERERYLKWYSKNQEKVKEYQKNYKINNSDKCREWSKKSRENTPKDIIRARGEQWRIKNKERMALLKREWHKKNPNKGAEYNHKRRTNLIGNIDAKDIEKIKNDNKECYWCNSKLNNSYHLDHYIPISKGGKNTIDNIVLSCPKCNLSKGAKDPYVFAISKGRLF